MSTADVMSATLPDPEAPLSLERYDELLWKFRAVFWEADPYTWRFSYVSEYAELLFGYPRRRWLEEENFWVKILHPEDREYSVNFCRQATAQGRDHCWDYRLIAADGRTVWVRDIVRVECDGFSQQPKRLYGILIDITEQKEQELQHHRDKEKLQRLLDELPVVVWTVDEHLRFTSSQGRGLSRLHLKEHQVVGRTLYEYFATADDNFLPIAMHRQALAGESVRYDFAWQGRVFHTVLEPWREGERITGVLGVAWDVTEQRTETELLRKKLCAEKRLEALVKRSERLLRALASIPDPRQRWHRAVMELIQLFGCSSAALLQWCPSGQLEVLAEAGAVWDWRTYEAALMRPRRELFFTVNPSCESSQQQAVFLPVGRRRASPTYLAILHPHWRQMPKSALRLLRMLADFLALNLEAAPPVATSSPQSKGQKRTEDDINCQERNQQGEEHR